MHQNTKAFLFKHFGTNKALTYMPSQNGPQQDEIAPLGCSKELSLVQDLYYVSHSGQSDAPRKFTQSNEEGIHYLHVEGLRFQSSLRKGLEKSESWLRTSWHLGWHAKCCPVHLEICQPLDWIPPPRLEKKESYPNSSAPSLSFPSQAVGIKRNGCRVGGWRWALPANLIPEANPLVGLRDGPALENSSFLRG